MSRTNGIRLGPLRVSDRGASVGGSLGPFSASASLTPGSRSRTTTKRFPLGRRKPEPTKLENALATIGIVAAAAPLMRKRGRRQVSDTLRVLRVLMWCALVLVGVVFGLVLGSVLF